MNYDWPLIAVLAALFLAAGIGLNIALDWYWGI